METRASGRSPRDLDIESAPSLQNWLPLEPETAAAIRSAAVLDCGWGRLLFGHTFERSEDLLEALRAERPGKRDIAFYLRDPHVLLALAPQELFLDPSHTYRLPLPARLPEPPDPELLCVRRLRRRQDAEAVNAIYLKRRMAPVDPDFLWHGRERDDLVVLVATDARTGAVLGTVTGVDHAAVFDDPENGSSLWCLAVDPQASFPGVGRALTCELARFMERRGRAFVDLSVMHDNEQAIALYEELGFQRVPAFCVKHKNPFNEPLFMGSDEDERLNVYARILVDEARRRGIAVEVIDAENGYFRLHSGGRSIVCRESLTELTSAIAMSRCDDKRVTARVLSSAGLRVPAQVVARDAAQWNAFLAAPGRVVVKPRRGEQGRGISVDLRTPEALAEAIERAHTFDADVLVEELVEGEDLRVIVIGFEVVAAAVRRPARVVGTGRHTVRRLIEKQSRRRAAATGGESRIPMDAETERCVREQGFELGETLPEGRELVVRKTANLHTGGTIHDVTAQLHPVLREASVAAAQALDIPVTGLDLLVPDVSGPDYVIIEANERPGLANHEPQPTAEAFVDLLFPESRLRLQQGSESQEDEE
jgi:GNAT-family acetyltransferase (TIGR03103 family)